MFIFGNKVGNHRVAISSALLEKMIIFTRIYL